MDENEDFEYPHLSVYEMCGEDGDESILEEMLDNPEADKAISQRAVESAIESGMPEAVAIRLYGLKSRRV